MNILVTGGAGFVGSNLIKALKEENKNYNISSLDNYFTGKESNHISGVIYYKGNTWDIENIFPYQRFDIVYHFGEYSRIAKSFDDIQYVEKNILYGTPKVLEMCVKWSAKLIYSASSSKFGNSGKDENLSPYSWMKAKMVELIKNYSNWLNLKYEICYFYNVYGPGQIMEGDYATVIGIFEKQYIKGSPLTVVSPGTQLRDFTYINDIVSGIILSCNVNMNGEWHLRSGENISIIDVARLFTDNYILIPERKGERVGGYNIENDTNKKLNWYPKMNIIDYIKNVKETNERKIYSKT